MAYTCPVCGYNKLKHPPQDENICPSCYTEFGYDDANRTHAELRQEWIGNGPHWEGANVMPAPPGWNPYEQLKNIGVLREEPLASSTNSTNIEIIDLGIQSMTINASGVTVQVIGRHYGMVHVIASLIGSTNSNPTVKAYA
jgi:hypothetical protein